MLDFSQFEAMTFDCYGTLIDWETGILKALRPILSVRGVRASDDEVLAHYARLEAAAESGEYMPYRDVLRSVVRGIGGAYGFTPEAREEDRLPDSVGRWRPFADTIESLQSLGSRYRLGVISNIDEDIFEQTRATLGVEFERVVTAELCRSYKPHRRNFNTMLALLDLPPDKVLHVAESLYHDVKPARELGMTTVWVNRRAARGGVGASGTAEAAPDAMVENLAVLAAAARFDGV
jgi:2-haloacid dehalogenase